MKLKDFAKLVKNEVSGAGIIQCSNIDDYFVLIRKYGLKEITVDEEDMMIIVQFYLASCGDKDPHKPTILKGGVIDKLLGIKLIYE